MTVARPALLLTLATSLACATAPAARRAAPASAPAAGCFAVEALDAGDRRLAESALLRAADGEGLYTLVGGIKPISTDFVEWRVRVHPAVDAAALDSVARFRRVLDALRCGDVEVVTYAYVATWPGRDTTTRERYVSAAVVDRAALRRAIAAHAPYFATLGITPESAPLEAILAVESAPRAERWRGYGYLYGYPDEAVDFFVRAGTEGDSTGKLVPRDFRRVETWRKHPERAGGPPTVSSFVYAVPKGAAESEGDRQLRAAAAAVYARYAPGRASRVGEGGAGIATLLRELRAGGDAARAR